MGQQLWSNGEGFEEQSTVGLEDVIKTFLYEINNFSDFQAFHTLEILEAYCLLFFSTWV